MNYYLDFLIFKWSKFINAKITVNIVFKNWIESLTFDAYWLQNTKIFAFLLILIMIYCQDTIKKLKKHDHQKIALSYLNDQCAI